MSGILGLMRYPLVRVVFVWFAAQALGAMLTAGGLQPGPEPGAPVTVFKGATLVDGTGSPAVIDAVLLVREGRIACAGPAAACPIPAGAATVDLSGRWITPGLVDAHVHFAQTAWADGRPDGMNVTQDYPYAAVVASQFANAATTYRSYLCSGVTAVFDVGGFPWSWTLRGDASRGVVVPRGAAAGLEAPHVAAAGPLLTWVAPRMDLPAEQVMVRVTTPGQGREVVRYLAGFQSDAVKVWFLGVPENPRPGMPSRDEVDAWVNAVGEQARALGLPLIVHATSLREAKLAVRAGAHLLVHSVSDEAVDEEFLALAREQGTIYTPTLIVGENWWAMSEAAFKRQAPVLDDPHGCVDPATRAKILSTPRYHDHPAVARLTEERVDARRQDLARQRRQMADNLRRVHEAGITIAMGTDAGNPFTVHGPSVYAEMERMQEAGLEAADVLVMSTRNGARAMGRQQDIGTLEAGKVADFLVLTQDPLQDVAAFRSVTHVARSGRLLAVGEFSFGVH